MCGIFGWAGKDPKKFNKDKFDKLGLYNIERGKDSCGVSVDGDIAIGASYGKKLFSDFIIDNNKLIPSKYPVVIGHTRQASVGNIVNESNAHPFGFGINKENEGYEFIGCHNGTLYNHSELAKQYNIEEWEEKEEFYEHSNHPHISRRKKIDSEILLEIIYTHKNFKVLNEYTGAAALMFTNTNEPNKVYIWKGASRLYDYASNKIEEERPLFYYIENKNSLYISSLYQPLLSIGGVKNESVFAFENNVLYTITNGDIKTAEKISIVRDNSTQKESYTTKNIIKRHDYDYCNFNKKTDDTNFINSSINEHIQNKVSTTNIYSEPLLIDQNSYGKRVYFNKLRYWKKGHLISGIYTFIKGYGFYELTYNDNKEIAITKMRDLIGIPFVDNDFDHSYGVEEIKTNHYYVPFKKEQFENLHFFVEGVKIRTLLDFKVFYRKHYLLAKDEMLDHIELSEISVHPIIDLSITTKHISNQGIVYNSKLVSTDIISPLGSELIYTIDYGNLKSTSISMYGKAAIWTPVRPHAEALKEKFRLRRIEEEKAKQVEGLDKLVANKSVIFESNSEILADYQEEMKLLNSSNPNSNPAKVLDMTKEFEDMDKISGEYELISENLNESISGIEGHINRLKDFDSDPEILNKITQLKHLKDQITIILETNN